MANNNDERWSGNKGEWGELYVFLKLLAQGEVQAIDEKLEKIENIYYPILKIMRKEKEEQIDYVIDKDEVVVKAESRELMRIDRSEIDKQAKCLLEGIKEGSGPKFELPQIEDFAKSIKVTTMKADSKTKNDICMQIFDEHTQFSSDLGFSIKSYVGKSTPTLLNPSKTTNFVYKVEGLTREQADEINEIKGITLISERMAKIRDYRGKLSFAGRFENKETTETFKRNLTMIDRDMPEIIADMLLDFYNNKGSGNEGIGKCKKLIEHMEERNPLGYGDTTLYMDKFKELLCEWALGMVATEEWNRKREVDGGYINVMRNGEILAYRNRNSFKQYLLDNTELETASTGRYGFMKLYEENGEMFINLNLQVRFMNMQLKGGSEE